MAVNFDQCETVLFLFLATIADVGSLVWAVCLSVECGAVWVVCSMEQGIVCNELEIRDLVKKGAFLGHTRSLP